MLVAAHAKSSGYVANTQWPLASLKRPPTFIPVITTFCSGLFGCVRLACHGFTSRNPEFGPKGTWQVAFAHVRVVSRCVTQLVGCHGSTTNAATIVRNPELTNMRLNLKLSVFISREPFVEHSSYAAEQVFCVSLQEPLAQNSKEAR